ncbi:MAG TPA: decaprenyl-phosphate phosphoribosyltransferase [Armatimonadota bacterium]|nr:decaprenyl-phosphate phosphoribosyltransferase [Armatimonadota bacterium]
MAQQTALETARAVAEALRPRQWLKNGIVFAGIIFSQSFLDLRMLAISVAAFALFCALSSSVYLLNDLGDLERDRRHPSKRLRPLASGRLPMRLAWAAAPTLAVASLALAFALRPEFGLLALGYYALNLAYTYWFKHVAIVDVMSIAVGFVIRAAAGAAAIAVDISPWLLVVTIFLALFLALSKRRHELVVLEAGAGDHRASLAHYSPQLLDQMIAVATTSTVIAYALYTMSPDTVEKFHTHNLVYTMPFVLFGIFRYLYLIHQRREGGAPERIALGDLPMLVNLVLWLAAVGLVLYT